MAKDKLVEYDATAANNTVVGDVNLAENSALPSDMNNAIREVMSHQKEAFGSGTPLYVDQTNNRVGFGEAAPDTPLHITKTINTAYSATNTTSNSNNLLKLENNSSTAGVFAGVMFRTGSGADGGLNWVQGSGNDGSFTFTNQNSTDVEMVRIQSNGSVGIGTASPDSNHKLEVASGGTAEAGIRSGNSSEAILNFGRTNDRLRGRIAYNNSSEYMAFWANQGEKMRLSGSNLLVGTATNDIYDSTSEVGSQISDGYLAVARSSTVAYFNRLSSDGDIVEFRKGGTTVGKIGVVNNNNPYISNDADNSGLQFASTSILPHYDSLQRDDAVDLGSSSARFKNAYIKGTVFAEAFTGESDTDTAIQMTGSNIIKFFTASSERLRIMADGRIAKGLTGSIDGADITHQVDSVNGPALLLHSTDTSGNAHDILQLRRNNSKVGSIHTTGSATAYNTSSDRRLKSNIQDASSASSKIDSIQVRQFDWNADGSHQDYGLIAQELQPIEPMAVSGSADSDEMMGVDYSKLVPLLIKEIQELRGRVAALEAS